MARSHLSVGEEFTGFERWVPGPSGGAWWSESRSFQGIIPHHAPPWLSSAGGAGDREGDPGRPALRPSLTPWGREGTACPGCVLSWGGGQRRLAQVRTRRKCPGTVSPVTQDQRPVWSWEGVVASARRGGEWRA